MFTAANISCTLAESATNLPLISPVLKLKPPLRAYSVLPICKVAASTRAISPS